MGDDLLNGPLSRRRAAGAERWRYGPEERGERGGSSREERERVSAGQVAEDAGLVLRLSLGHGLGVGRPFAATRSNVRRYSL